jgi:hypothetical protein
MRKRNYINNRELYSEMVRFHLLYKDDTNTKITNYIGKSILLICNNLSKKPNFSGYTYKEDMISDAICDCVAAVKSFNVEKTNNPFAYFTQTAWNAFLRRIEKESKQSVLKHKNLINMYVMPVTVFENDKSSITSNEFSDEIIKNYEDKLTERKRRAKLNNLTKKGLLNEKGSLSTRGS